MHAVETCLERLKLLALARSNMTMTLPCHTQHLAAIVSRHTNLHLSETALLRLYHFLPAKFPPSHFTTNVLAIYCGYKDYTAFCAEQHNAQDEGTMPL